MGVRRQTGYRIEALDVVYPMGCHVERSTWNTVAKRRAKTERKYNLCQCICSFKNTKVEPRVQLRLCLYMLPQATLWARPHGPTCLPIVQANQNAPFSPYIFFLPSPSP